MNKVGTYIAISQEKLQEMLEAQTSVRAFIENPDSYDKVQLFSMGAAWDAFRFIFQDTIEDIVGSEHLENCDLGQECYLIHSHRIGTVLAQLLELNELIFESILVSDVYQNAKFYEAQFFTSDDRFDLLIKLFNGLTSFMREALQKNRAVLFFIENSEDK